MQLHPLKSFEINNFKKHYQNQPKFNGVFSRNNLPKIKEGAYVINLDEYESIETHRIGSYVNGNNETYFDSFEDDTKISITNIFRVQAYNSIM